MKLLAIDTATEACSAALYLDGEVHERFEVAPREHARLILPMVESLLAEAGVSVRALDGLAFGRGPGSFTGVRIATGVAQGIAFGADLPVVPVSTLAALAQGALMDLGATRVLAAIDARMGEIYWGAYFSCGDGSTLAAEEERVCVPEAAPRVAYGQACPCDDDPPMAVGAWVGVGSGFAAYGEVLERRYGNALSEVAGDRLPRARDVAWLGVRGLRHGRAVPAEQATPVYLRDQVAKKPGER